MFQQIRNEDGQQTDLVRLRELLGIIQRHEADIRFLKLDFDKNYQEERLTQNGYIITPNFDAEFSQYVYHSQSLKTCRIRIFKIDETISNILGNAKNNYNNVLIRFPKLNRIGQSLFQITNKLVLHLDEILAKPKLFKVHDIYSRLRQLEFALSNWCGEINTTIKNYEKARKLLR